MKVPCISTKDTRLHGWKVITHIDIKASGGNESVTAALPFRIFLTVQYEDGCTVFRQALKEQRIATSICNGSSKVLVSRILKLYACEFRTDKRYARNDAFRFAQSNGIKQKFSLIKQMAKPGWLKNFENQPNFEYCFLGWRTVFLRFWWNGIKSSKVIDLDKSCDVSAGAFGEPGEFFTDCSKPVVWGWMAVVKHTAELNGCDKYATWKCCKFRNNYDHLCRENRK